jgi:hypothetical protein
MNITATFHKILSEESGTSKTGNAWTKANVKLTYTSGKFDKELIPTVWGADIAILKQLPSGTEITAGVELSSREFKEKVYHDIKLFNVKGNGASAPVESDWRKDPDFATEKDGENLLPF